MEIGLNDIGIRLQQGGVQAHYAQNVKQNLEMVFGNGSADCRDAMK